MSLLWSEETLLGKPLGYKHSAPNGARWKRKKPGFPWTGVAQGGDKSAFLTFEEMLGVQYFDAPEMPVEERGRLEHDL